MVQNLSLSNQQLAKTLGQLLPGQELNLFLKQIKVQEPAAGKQFWQASEKERSFCSQATKLVVLSCYFLLGDFTSSFMQIVSSCNICLQK